MVDRVARTGTVVLELGPEPESFGTWFRSLISHREVLIALAAKDFKVRYKRASLGVLWAVALPLVQSIVMIVVFSRFARVQTQDLDYLGYVLAGMSGWAYLTLTVTSAATSVVDGAGLTDKVWFPRALLVLAPVLANLIGLAISLAIVVPVELLRGNTGIRLVLLAPAVALLLGMTTGIGLVTSAAFVWFRDVRFIVQAVLLVAFYATPVVYPLTALGRLARVVRCNPFTGVIHLFQLALVGGRADWLALLVSAGTAVVLLAWGARLHQRNDRLFVDLL